MTNEVKELHHYKLVFELEDWDTGLDQYEKEAIKELISRDGFHYDGRDYNHYWAWESWTTTINDEPNPGIVYFQLLEAIEKYKRMLRPDLFQAEDNPTPEGVTTGET